MIGSAQTLAKIFAKQWGGTALSLVSARENTVFRMQLPDGQTAALRLHRDGYQSRAAIESELWFCARLAGRGLPVPRPQPTQQGAFLAEVAGGFASVVEWLPGEPSGAAGVPLRGAVADQVAHHFALGQLLARLHEETLTLTLPEGFDRPRWDIDGLLGEAPFWGRFWEHPCLTEPEAVRFHHLRQQLRDELAPHMVQGPILPVHADVLRENVLVSMGALALIDFDDCGSGHPLYDMGTVLSQNLYEPASPGLRRALSDGYATRRAVDLRLVDLFTLARCLASVGWTMSRLALDNPVMRRHIARAFHCADKVFP